MENFEVIEKMSEYLLKQDPNTVCTLCAGLMVDIHRFIYIDKLPEDEAERLMQRSYRNVSQLHEFIKGGPPEEPIVVYKNA